MIDHHNIKADAAMTAPIVDEEVQLAAREHRRAWSVVDQVTSERETWRSERLKEIALEADRLFADRLKEAKVVLIEAQARLDEARTAAALTVARETPLGTIMVEWELPSWREYPLDKSPRLTGRKGTLEIMTPGGDHPNNLADYSRANPGEPVIRLLKSDGKPSKKYIHERRDMEWWRPEGQPFARPEPDGEEG